MKRAPFWLNTGWMLSCRAEANRFRRAVKHVRRTQESILARLIQQNRDTSFGARHRFSAIASVRDFQKSIPVARYEELQPDIERIANGEAAVLTSEPVMLLEPTGGSTSAEKLVPYTPQLRREFQRAVSVWVSDVMQKLPKARDGKAYWSISPMTGGRRTTRGGIPIGFDDDREYLSRWQRWAVSRLLISPGDVKRLKSFENARYVTQCHLLACADLAIVSVWSPTFLLTLLSDVREHADRILHDFERGVVRLPHPDKDTEPSDFPIDIQATRIAQLKDIFNHSDDVVEQFSQCWPKLALISCWADGTSSNYAQQLRELFPTATLQPKGLLATEGVVSIPLIGQSGGALALRSHFYEFVQVGPETESSHNDIRLAHELEEGEHYRVLLTTGGGLYRYDLADIVQVVGFLEGCPLVRFSGRHQHVSDLVGEKLNEQHVRGSIEAACHATGVRPRFFLLAPTEGSPARYRLYLEATAVPTIDATVELGVQLEARLSENPQYSYAVTAGQLLPVEVCLLSDGGAESFLRAGIQRGQRAGNIKPKCLDSWQGWQQEFSNRILMSVDPTTAAKSSDLHQPR